MSTVLEQFGPDLPAAKVKKETWGQCSLSVWPKEICPSGAACLPGMECGILPMMRPWIYYGLSVTTVLEEASGVFVWLFLPSQPQHCLGSPWEHSHGKTVTWFPGSAAAGNRHRDIFCIQSSSESNVSQRRRGRGSAGSQSSLWRQGRLPSTCGHGHEGQASQSFSFLPSLARQKKALEPLLSSVRSEFFLNHFSNLILSVHFYETHTKCTILKHMIQWHLQHFTAFCHHQHCLIPEYFNQPKLMLYKSFHIPFFSQAPAAINLVLLELPILEHSCQWIM